MKLIQRYLRTSSPIKSVLSECKARISPAHGCKNIEIRAYMFLCGGKIMCYQGFVILGVAIFDIFCHFEGLELLEQLLPITAFACAMPYAWVVGTIGKSASSTLDEVIWVADLLERNASSKEKRRHRTLTRVSRVYFWLTFWASVASVAPMAIASIVEGSTIFPTPLPDSKMVGEFAASGAYWAIWIWQSIFFTLLVFAYAWVDGLYFGVVLIIYALTKMVAKSMRRVDFSQKGNIMNLIRAHQILLKADELCRESMSLTYCVFVIGSVYLSVVSGYATIVDTAPMDRMIDVVVTATSVLRFGYMSELISEASTEVSSAIYESPWIEAIFLKKAPLSSIRHLVLGVSVRAQTKPMYIRAGFMGAVGNSFSLQYGRALYSYFNTLQNIA